jgi:hypothetical protein
MSEVSGASRAVGIARRAHRRSARYRRSRYLVLISLLAATPALAQQPADPLKPAEPAPPAPSARAAVSAPEVELGRPFSLFVTVDQEDGVEVNLPSSLGLGEFVEEVRRVANDRTLDDGTRVREFELQLIAWVIGDFQVPGIPVTYVVGGTAHQTQTNPVGISVVSAVGEGEGTLRDIAPPVKIDRRDWMWIIISIVGGLLVVGLLVIVIGVYLLRKRRPRRVVRAAPARPVPTGSARDVALARLAELEERLGEADLRPVVFAMSEVVREYLGRCYGVAALDMTTGELCRALASRGELAGLLPGLRSWLEETDLVKYAGESPPRDEVATTLDRARSLVEAAWPHPSTGSGHGPSTATPEQRVA